MSRSLACGSVLVALGLAAACGTSASPTATNGDGGSNGDAGANPGNGDGGNQDTNGDGGTNPTGDDGGSSTTDGGSGSCASCPTGFACETGGTVCKSNGVPAFGNVYLIVEENHSYATVKGATYIASLIADNASASNYMDSLVHPSLPNYLTLTSGSNQGITCDCQAGNAGGGTCPGSCNVIEASACNCAQPTTVANIADRVEAKGLTWHAYGEDMNAPGCDKDNHGEYVARHIPFVYYDAIQSSPTRCANVVPWTATSFAADLGKYSYSFIAPNLGDDGHTSYNNVDEVTATDGWLKTNVPTITGAPSFKKNGVLFIVWDEGDEALTSTDDHVLLIVISPFATKTVTAAAYSHTSLLDTIETGLGLGTPHLTSSTAINDVWKK